MESKIEVKGSRIEMLDDANKVFTERIGREYIGLMPGETHIAVSKDGEPNYVPAYTNSFDQLVPALASMCDAEDKELSVLSYLRMFSGIGTALMYKHKDLTATEATAIVLARYLKKDKESPIDRQGTN